MIRQLFSVASSARFTRAGSTATLKSQIQPQQPWRIASPSITTSQSTRLFSATSPGAFTFSEIRNSSPFRLSSEKPTQSHSTHGPDRSPYQPKRQWPPDMSKLSPKHQFRLERKYRRRAALKYARPKFIKIVTLAQWVVIGFVLIYSVLFMNWDTRDTPFDGIREKFFSSFGAVFSSPPPPRPVKRDDEKN